MTLQFVEASVIFLGFIALAFYLLVNLRNSGLKGPATALLKPVSTLRLGTRERVIVLEINDEWIVVGVSPSGMRTLHTLKKPEGAVSESPLRDLGFASWLEKISLHRRS